MKQQGVDVICYGLIPPEPQLIFDDERIANRSTSGDFAQLRVNSYNYFILGYAVYGQGRALAELMYFCLHEPSTINNPFIHDHHRQFAHVKVELRGDCGFMGRKSSKDFMRLPNMPTTTQLRDSLREHDLFKEDPYLVGNNTIWPMAIFLNRVLSQEREVSVNIEEVLQKLIADYNSSRGRHL